MKPRDVFWFVLGGFTGIYLYLHPFGWPYALNCVPSWQVGIPPALLAP